MLLLTNITQLLTISGNNAAPRRGPGVSHVGLVTAAAVRIAGGRVVATGRQREILRHPWFKKNRKKLKEIDCRGKTVIPGFVDSHTHLIFAEPRLIDFEKRIGG